MLIHHVQYTAVRMYSITYIFRDNQHYLQKEIFGVFSFHFNASRSIGSVIADKDWLVNV